MLPQWKDELESRFGLTFEILDRHYVERVRGRARHDDLADASPQEELAG